MATQVSRLSVSVPKAVMNDIDGIARSRKLSRSKLVADCLAAMIEREKKELMAEGYRAMAKEHAEFADLASEAGREALPPWKGK